MGLRQYIIVSIGDSSLDLREQSRLLASFIFRNMLSPVCVPPFQSLLVPYRASPFPAYLIPSWKSFALDWPYKSRTWVHPLPLPSNIRLIMERQCRPILLSDWNVMPFPLGLGFPPLPFTNGKVDKVVTEMTEVGFCSRDIASSFWNLNQRPLDRTAVSASTGSTKCPGHWLSRTPRDMLRGELGYAA